MRSLVHYLEDIDAPSALATFSALDTYFDFPDSAVLHAYTEADIIQLAKSFDNLTFPGLDGIDAACEWPEGLIFLTCVDSVKKPPVHPFSMLNIVYDPAARRYYDPHGVYGDIRRKYMRFLEDSTRPSPWRLIADAAIALSRYGVSPEEGLRFDRMVDPAGAESFTVMQQRILIEELMASKNPREGFALLRKTGFVDLHWPELAAMYHVRHTKEHHPEGNVWEHTLETFSHRKTRDLTLSLGLLFHDAGKPLARPNEGRMFDRHSQIGAGIAARFMRRLGYEEGTVRDVGFLVREHMLPSFLHELPTFRTESVMSSLLFPMLLELYRCDLSSTYRGPDGYYRACKVYRSYLKNVRNPFRTADGKKILNQYVDGRR